MNQTSIALYDDIAAARQVVEDLVKADFERSAISLITNDAQNQYRHYLDKDYTPKDDAVSAGEGAGFGAVVGALTGILVGIAALTIPGIGLAIAAGPIVAGLTGIVAGAVTGGIVGALVKSGVPEDEAPYYAEGIRRGGTLVSIETADTLRARDIMHRHGSINIHERISLWRQDGWKGFNVESESGEDEQTIGLPAVMVTPPTHAAAIHSVPAAPPIMIIPAVPSVEEEPLIDEEDTVESAASTPTIATTETTPPDTVPSRGVVEKGSQADIEDSVKYDYQLSEWVKDHSIGS